MKSSRTRRKNVCVRLSTRLTLIISLHGGLVSRFRPRDFAVNFFEGGESA